MMAIRRQQELRYHLQHHQRQDNPHEHEEFHPGLMTLLCISG